MDRKPVASSNIESIGYDPKSRTLEVEFRGGSVYTHNDVPPETYDGLMAAASKGKYYHEHLKNRFRVARVGDV